MAQKYMLIPLPIGLFSGYDLTTRAVIGALYNRLRLSGYNQIGSQGGTAWYDEVEQRVYCVYTHAELVELIGVSEKTIRRSLNLLRDDGFIWWRKARYAGANRYFMDERIMQELRGQ